MKMYNEYLIWLKRTHGISPESLYMGVNEMRELIQMRKHSFVPLTLHYLYLNPKNVWIPTIRSIGNARCQL